MAQHPELSTPTLSATMHSVTDRQTDNTIMLRADYTAHNNTIGEKPFEMQLFHLTKINNQHLQVHRHLTFVILRQHICPCDHQLTGYCCYLSVKHSPGWLEHVRKL